MAEGHAKLSLRGSAVSIFDAVAAIRMYEINLASQTGYSYLLEGFTPTENVCMALIR